MMRRALLLSCLLVVPTFASAQAPADPPSDPAIEKAREAYNAGRYNEAARRFLAVVQAHPKDAGSYRSLARARVWADEAAGAVVAYRFYLQLAPPDASDREKVEAELQLAERKASPTPPIGPPPKAARTLAAAEVRAKAGTFAGPDGAFGAIAAAVEAGYIGPGLDDVRRMVRGQLRTRSEDAITAWWRPEQTVSGKTLTTLAAGWAEAHAEHPATPAEAPMVTALQGLSKLRAGDARGALEVLAEVAPGDPRLRYAQALALFRAERFEEAEAVLAALDGQVEDRRIGILEALVQVRLGSPDAPENLRRALLE